MIPRPYIAEWQEHAPWKSLPITKNVSSYVARHRLAVCQPKKT
tara:strand:+ start:318 stop:446 length:129 start_codon:yes stop_codon:yes gene_type:complete